MKQSAELTNLQRELLNLFSYELPEKQLKEIKDLLSHYFADKVTEEMDKFWVGHNLDDNILDQWKKEHMRTKYE